MYTIRKPKRVGQAMPPSEVVEPPNYAVPRWCARQCVVLLRMTHFAFDEMARMVQVMPPEKRVLYQYLAGVELRPSFFNALKLIDQSEECGLLSPEEASSLRAGRVGDIDNPLPDDEGTGLRKAVL